MGRRAVEVMQIGKRKCQLIGIGALERGAAEHQVDAEARDIGHHAAPQELHCSRSRAVGFQDAGTSELEESRACGKAGQHRRDVVLARGVEAAGAGCVGVAHQPIGAHDRGPSILFMLGAIQHQQMVADLIEAIEIAGCLAHRGRRHRRHLLIEDAIAQALRLLDFGTGFRKPDFKRARHCKHGPLCKTPFKRSGLVNVDQWIAFVCRVPPGAPPASQTLSHERHNFTALAGAVHELAVPAARDSALGWDRATSSARTIEPMPTIPE